MKNAELLQRLRSLSEQVPEGEWKATPGVGRRHWFVYLTMSHGVTTHVHSKREIDLACTLRNHVPQILEALEQVAGSEVSE